MITLDNTDATVINSYVSVDWRYFLDDDEFGYKNGFDLVNGANLFMYGVTISEDETGIMGIDDFREMPVGLPSAEYVNYVPYRVEAGCQAYYYKWLEVPVMDRYDVAVENAYVNATFDHTDQTIVNRVSSINDLTKWPDATWQLAKKRVTDYLGRLYGVTAAEYNITRADGKAMLPLLTTFINSTNYPNGGHVGEYNIKVNYTGTTTAYSTCDFMPVPNIAPGDNIVILPVQLSALELPRPIGSMGLIVNDNDEVTMDAISGGPLAINDFIIVEDNGELTLSHASVLMAYSGTAPYHITVRDNGHLILNDVDLKTTNNLPLVIYLEDNAMLTMTESSTTTPIDILASDNVQVAFRDTSIAGNFDVADGANMNVRLVAVNTVFSRNLDNFGGTSNATLTGCYSPSSGFLISPSDSAKVWIYRNVKVTVYDGLAPPNPLEDVNVLIVNRDPEHGAGLGDAGVTDSAGKFDTALLSDYIYYNPTKMEVAEAHYALYHLTTTYTLNSGIVHQETTGLELAAYPLMGIIDASVSEAVVLENVLPDLDPPLTVWPLDVDNGIGRGNQVLINATVTNTGDAEAKGVTVWFQDIFNGESENIDTRYNASMAPGAIWNISFPYTWSSEDDIGWHNITVTVDPNDYIDEQNETNNQNYTLVNVTSQSDLMIQNYYDVWFSTSYPLVGEEFTIFANVWNEGDIASTNVTVSFYEAYSGDLLDNVTAELVPASLIEPTVASIDVTFTVNGTYSILVVIDEANEVPEVDETNNDNSQWPRILRVYEFPDLNLTNLEVIAGTNLVEIGMGGGTPLTDCTNRTTVTLRARVKNDGDLFASSVYVQFYDGTQLIGTSSTIANINTGSYAYATYPWLTLTAGLQQIHNLRAVAYASGGLVSNELTRTFTVYDNRPDIELDGAVLANNRTEVTADTVFDLNVTLTNNGIMSAEDFAVEIYSSREDWNSTLDAWNSGNRVPIGRIGNATVESLADGETVTLTIRCTGINVGDHDILVNVDSDLNRTDVIDYDGVTRAIGYIEEYNERNNNNTLAVTAIMPDLIIDLQLPSAVKVGDAWSNVFVEGKTTSVLVTGVVVRSDTPGIGVEGIEVSIQIQGVGSPVVVTSGPGGFFSGNLDVSAIGNYTVQASGDGIPTDTAWFRIDAEVVIPWWIIIVIIILVVAVIIGITAYLYFVGLGKTVQCGDCGAFIPEGATKCPKCGVEFETEVAKCSVCGAWVPIDVKNCPDCGTEFTVGTEDLDDYEAKMKRQYDDIVRKFREQAKKEIGREFTETEFQTWWAKQPTFMTFDQWLKEEEEMKRMGSRKCPSCDMDNSVTAKICHKCGTVMGEPEPEAPKKPEGKMPPGKAPQKAQPTPQQQTAPQQPKPQQATPQQQPAQQPAAAQPAPQQAAPAAQPAPGKKHCPSCGMEVNVAEKVCPICQYNFEQPDGGQRVIRKPIKKIVRRPGEGGGEQGGQP